MDTKKKSYLLVESYRNSEGQLDTVTHIIDVYDFLENIFWKVID